jgi:4-alpha-glucanotransferase
VAVRLWTLKLEKPIESRKFRQFIFFRQWERLKKYANDRAIRLIGDMPLFVSLDSAEVWSQPEMFYLENGHPTVQAGVPPDYFSKTGQLWGNPLYRWDVIARNNYRWWIDRFRATHAMVDIIRLDHFRGFVQYWEVPGQDTTALNGRWVAGPGEELFNVVQNTLGKLPIIAEDLGIITPDVDALRDKLGFPGMRVLEFAFTNEPKADDYRPHNYPRNCVVYTGTHDNDTILGWFNKCSAGEDEEERARRCSLALKYIGCDGSEINWAFIRLAHMSVAEMAVIQLQDVLGLGSKARMNTPGTSEGNWTWRFTPGMLTDAIESRLKESTELYDRHSLVSIHQTFKQG